MLIINCNENQRGAGRRRLGPRHPLSNYRLMTVPHRHDPPGSLTHLFFYSPPYIAPHTRYVGQQIQGRLKGGGGNGASDPAIPSPIAFLERLPHRHDLRSEEGEGEAKAIEQFTLQKSLFYETGDFPIHVIT